MFLDSIFTSLSKSMIKGYSIVMKTILRTYKRRSTSLLIGFHSFISSSATENEKSIIRTRGIARNMLIVLQILYNTAVAHFLIFIVVFPLFNLLYPSEIYPTINSHRISSYNTVVFAPGVVCLLLFGLIFAFVQNEVEFV